MEHPYLNVTTTAPARADKKPERSPGIDAVRFIGAAAVVAIHTVSPHHVNFGLTSQGIIDQLCRWAVPFFFISSGYFLVKKSARARKMIGDYLRRIVPMFAVWALFYVAITKGGLSRLSNPDFLVWVLVTGGPGWHLWYLPALLSSFMIVILMRQARLSVAAMLIFGATIYIIGLSQGSYYALLNDPLLFTPDRLIPYPPILDGRNGCFPLIFVVIGVWLAETGWQPTRMGAFLICLAGAGLHCANAYWLDLNRIFPFHRNDFLPGTILFGTGAFLIAQQLQPVLPVRLLAQVGRFSLGIYAIHVVFVLVINRIFSQDDLTAGVIKWAFVLVSSTLAVIILGRIKLLQFLLR